MAIPGSVVNVGKLVTPGGAQGQSGPSAVSADPGNIAVLGSDNLILVPQSTIWSQRLRSFNAIGNPNFEVDQRNIHAGLTNPTTGFFLLDRFYLSKTGTMAVNSANPIRSNPGVVPGTNFGITSSQLGLSLTTQQASLGTGDYLTVTQIIEGSNWRELCTDVSSLSLLAYSTVAPLKFSVAIRDSPGTQSLVKLCTITNAATWTLIQLPNLPIPPSGNFSFSPGAIGYTLTITMAAGSNFVAPAADVWNAGNFLAAPGADNFASKPVNSAIYFCFIQHEPGPLCTTLIDKPFSQNLDECQRYYQKTYPYSVAPGTAPNASGALTWYALGASTANTLLSVPFKKTMAKAPTMVGYSTQTGAASIVRDVTGAVERSISSYPNLGDSGFGGFVLTGAPAANAQLQAHYTADTGW